MADIKNKNELKRRIELFMDELDYSINEDFCKETMVMMFKFIEHVNHQIDSKQKQINKLQEQLKKATNEEFNRGYAQGMIQGKVDARVMKENADGCVGATFTAYMILATTTLFEDLNFRDKRMVKFIEGFYRRLDLYSAGQLSVDEMEKKLIEKAGVVIEHPLIRM